MTDEIELWEKRWTAFGLHPATRLVVLCIAASVPCWCLGNWSWFAPTCLGAASVLLIDWARGAQLHLDVLAFVYKKNVMVSDSIPQEDKSSG